MDWRWILSVGIAVAGLAIPLSAPAAEGDGAQNQAVDAAHKSLLAANGLYTRGLFKAAADQYTEFLEQNPNHAEATSARVRAGGLPVQAA